MTFFKTIQELSDFLKRSFQIAAKSSTKPAKSNLRQKLEGASHFEESLWDCHFIMRLAYS